MRGKDTAENSAVLSTMGSPPLARERQVIFFLLDWSVRITPACAGKTSKTRPVKIIARDHPRSRGKDRIQEKHYNHTPGSPPLTRERPLLLKILVLASRITPAHAGKTKQKIYQRKYLKDHPRSRGKDIKRATVTTVTKGSPPLTRERQVMRVNDIDNKGITPAHAGKTVKDPFILATIADFKSQIYLTSVQGVLPASPSPMLDEVHFH